MEAVWLWVADFWWTVPIGLGAGTVGVLGATRLRRRSTRRLAYDAARADLSDARSHAVATRSNLRLARAELARAQAERAASRAPASDVAAARQVLHTVQRDLRAASAAVRFRREQLRVARTALRGRALPDPLTDLRAREDAVTSQWVAYETDPARLIAFPAMSDARVPTTGVFLQARARASQRRPAAGTRLDRAGFAAYRDAVVDLERAFTAAEQEAWRQARAAGTAPPEETPPPAWTEAVQDVLGRGADALTRAAEVAADAFGSRRRRRPSDDDPPQT